MNSVGPLTREKRILKVVGFSLTLMLLAITWGFGVRPASERHQLLANQQKQRTRFLCSTEVMTTDYHRAKQQLDAKLEQSERMCSRIAATPRESEFMDFLSTKASENTISLSNFRPQSSKVGELISSSQIRISGTGSYTNIVRFLDELRRLPRMTRITRLEVSTLGGNHEKCAIEMTIELFFNFDPSKFGLGDQLAGVRE